MCVYMSRCERTAGKNAIFLPNLVDKLLLILCLYAQLCGTRVIARVGTFDGCSRHDIITGRSATGNNVRMCFVRNPSKKTKYPKIRTVGGATIARHPINPKKR